MRLRMLGSLYSIKKATAVKRVRTIAASWVQAPTIRRIPPIISTIAKIFKTIHDFDTRNSPSEINQRFFSLESFKMPVFKKVKPAATLIIKGASKEYVKRSGKMFNMRVNYSNCPNYSK